MLERMKEIPFINESAAVKVVSDANGGVLLERNDKVVWAQERCRFPGNSAGISCYVEADKFFALFGEIHSLEQTTCLIVTLKNGAKYELPFLDVSWEPVEMPELFDGTIDFRLSDLSISTLKNLVKPELQCIYIDPDGAISCDFMTACFSKAISFPKPFLLPADIQLLVDGELCQVLVDDKLYIKASGAGFCAVTAAPVIEDQGMWDSLRGMLPDEGSGEVLPWSVTVERLLCSLKRLQMFGDYAQFDGARVCSGANFEPYEFSDLGQNSYEIEKLMKILSIAKRVAEKDGNIVIQNNESTFLVSPMEDA